MTALEQLGRWQAIAKLAGDLLAITEEGARGAHIVETAKRLLAMEEACLVPIGRPIAELSAPGRNQLPFFEYLALQRRPVFVQDAAADHGFAMPPEIASWRFPTLLFVPLIARDVALGVLALGANEVRELTGEEEALLGALVPQVTASLDAETLKRDAARHEAYERFLAELDDVLLNPDLPQVLARTVELVRRVLQVERVLVFTEKKGKHAQGFDITAAEGCPYASEGCLTGHACGKLVNSLSQARSIEARNAESLKDLIAEDQSKCIERQMAIAPIRTHRSHHGALVMVNKVSGEDFTLDELDLLESIGRKLGLAYDNHAMFEQLQTGSLETIKGLARALDSKDKYTANHSDNVSQYGFVTAVAMGLTPDECQRIRLAGILHDIGKIGIPDAILNKPGKLTDEEFKIIKTHPGKGFRILEPFRELRDVADAACSHHERWDGNGYPRRLKGEEISIGGRILALADAWDTLTSDRKYRPRVPIMDALIEMRRCAGAHFDPKVVQSFFLALADMGTVDLNKNELPPRELLLEMADMSHPLERFLPPPEPKEEPVAVPDLERIP